MPTHGKARETTVNNLRNLTPFQRAGFAMSGISGKFNGTGRMQGETLAEYMGAQDVIYTVLSYGTPIAWVAKGDVVVIPEDKYSVTTTNHQNMCRVYLNS